MKKIIVFLFMILISSEAFAYREVFNAHTGRLDKVGSQVSGDIQIPCPSGQVMVASGGGTWACGTTSGSGAPTDAEYYTASSNATLTNEVVVTKSGVGSRMITGVSPFTSGRIGYFDVNGDLQASSVTSADAVAVSLAGENYATLSGQQITFADINLGTHVTSTLPVGNGGTGRTSISNDAVLVGNNAGTGFDAPPLTDCTGAGKAVTYISATNSFGCNTISGSGTPGGSSGDLQYNNASSFGGMTGVSWDGVTVRYTGAVSQDMSAVTPNTTASGFRLPTVVSRVGAYVSQDNAIAWNASLDTLVAGTGAKAVNVGWFPLSASWAGTSATRFIAPFGSDANATASNVDVWQAPFDIVCREFHAEVNAAPGAGTSWTMAANIAGSAVTKTCSIADTLVRCDDDSDSVSILKGQTVYFEQNRVSTAGAPGESTIAMWCRAD